MRGRGRRMIKIEKLVGIDAKHFEVETLFRSSKLALIYYFFIVDVATL